LWKIKRPIRRQSEAGIIKFNPHLSKKDNCSNAAMIILRSIHPVNKPPDPRIIRIRAGSIQAGVFYHINCRMSYGNIDRIHHAIPDHPGAGKRPVPVIVKRSAVRLAVVIMAGKRV